MGATGHHPHAGCGPARPQTLNPWPGRLGGSRGLLASTLLLPRGVETAPQQAPRRYAQILCMHHSAVQPICSIRCRRWRRPWRCEPRPLPDPAALAVPRLAAPHPSRGSFGCAAGSHHQRHSGTSARGATQQAHARSLCPRMALRQLALARRSGPRSSPIAQSQYPCPSVAASVPMAKPLQ